MGSFSLQVLLALNLPFTLFLVAPQTPLLYLSYFGIIGQVCFPRQRFSKAFLCNAFTLSQVSFVNFITNKIFATKWRSIMFFNASSYSLVRFVNFITKINKISLIKLPSIFFLNVYLILWTRQTEQKSAWRGWSQDPHSQSWTRSTCRRTWLGTSWTTLVIFWIMLQRCGYSGIGMFFL